MPRTALATARAGMVSASTSVAASGRQGDICFGEDKLKIRLIYKHTDGREESREIDLTREDD